MKGKRRNLNLSGSIMILQTKVFSHIFFKFRMFRFVRILVPLCSFYLLTQIH